MPDGGLAGLVERSEPAPLQVSCLTCRFAGRTSGTVARSHGSLDHAARKKGSFLPRGMAAVFAVAEAPVMMPLVRAFVCSWYVSVYIYIKLVLILPVGSPLHHCP